MLLDSYFVSVAVLGAADHKAKANVIKEIAKQRIGRNLICPRVEKFQARPQDRDVSVEHPEEHLEGATPVHSFQDR